MLILPLLLLLSSVHADPFFSTLLYQDIPNQFCSRFYYRNGGVFKPEAVMRNMLPVIMAGILGIYGLIASIIMVYASMNLK